MSICPSFTRPCDVLDFCGILEGKVFMIYISVPAIYTLDCSHTLPLIYAFVLARACLNACGFFLPFVFFVMFPCIDSR